MELGLFYISMFHKVTGAHSSPELACWICDHWNSGLNPRCASYTQFNLTNVRKGGLKQHYFISILYIP